jgi:ubiquinone/menaquinone biosynthesis C-methylase UbiE
VDWGVGSYERIAAEIEPAAAACVDALELASGHILDLACGNGNAAVYARRAGLETTGVDASRRLIDAARERFRAAGHEGSWEVGDVQRLPFADDSFDGAVSVFGIVFAEDGRTAADEARRVVRQGGPIAITAWLPEGGIGEMMRHVRGVVAEYAEPSVDAPQPVAWHEEDALRALFGAGTRISRHSIRFTAESPAAWVVEQRKHHPAWAAMHEAVPPQRFDDLVDEVTEILSEHNEDPEGFAVSSPYLLARAEA